MGEKPLSSQVAERLALRRKRADLKPRELEVLQFLVKGRSNKEIAATLNLAEITVKVHLQTLFVKLGVQDRTEAAIYAVRHGIVHID
jgi:two-component system NarL family response regulator